MRRAHVLVLALAALTLGGRAAEGDRSPWRAGVATADITPDGPVWMAGYASRKKPSESVAQRLFAKALALEDERGGRFVLVTLDLIAVSKTLREAVERHVRERHSLPAASLLLNASHTHSGPAPYARGVSDPAYVDRALAYAAELERKVNAAVGEALGALQPATLHYTRARAGFAMNRRLRVGADIRNSANPDGPVDHDVPVLRVSGADGKLRAVVFGYACHNTVTGFYTINGDYAAYAQAFVEEAHPGATALFVAGAGGDQNPYPRHVSLEQAAQHGRALANAVETALGVIVQRPVRGPLRSALAYADLRYAGVARADLEARVAAAAPVDKPRVQELLVQLDRGALPASYPCPVQVVQFGGDLTLIAIGGEATVEYSLRLKRELADRGAAVWVAGYSNDVFGYLGSRRVIEEGGYEGYSANLNRHPGPWAPDAEDRVIGRAHELLRSLAN